MQFLVHMVVTYLDFLIKNLFPRITAALRPSSVLVIQFSASSLPSGGVTVFYSSHADPCSVMSPCGVYFAFP